MTTRERYEFTITGDSMKLKELLKDIRAILRPKSLDFDFQELINDDCMRYHLISTLEKARKDRIILSVVNCSLEDTRQYVRAIHERYGLDTCFHGGEMGYYALVKYDPEERFYKDNYLAHTYYPFGARYDSLEEMKDTLLENGYTRQDIDKVLQELKSNDIAYLPCIIPKEEMSDGDGNLTILPVKSLTYDDVFKEDIRKENRLEDYGYGVEHTSKGTLVVYDSFFYKKDDGYKKKIVIHLFKENTVLKDIAMEFEVAEDTSSEDIHERIRKITEF